ncbi:MAG: VWA domain-containing protein [Gammaproteobacteria bacterium]|nr:VWA domain-containing protein [Gammaproteobacteria bacterium]
MLEAFHFLRPEWFFTIPLIALMLFFLRKHSEKNSGWEEVCDPELLQYQLAQQTEQAGHGFYFYHWGLPFIFLIAIIALAGPTWEKKEQPAFQQGKALVIILDLSLSMNAKDIKPSRLDRAKLKIIDILKQKKEGQTALIAFAGDAHTVSPLTIDNKTIVSLLPSLESSIMPLNGSHLADALSTAKLLFKNSGFAQGDILLLSDGIDPSQQKVLEVKIKALRQQGYRFSVIGVGSLTGSPIPLPRQGGFIKDQSGQVVLSKLTPSSLKKLSSIGGGSYHKLSLDDSDFDALLKAGINDDALMDKDNQLEQWVDAGAYLLLLLIPLALFNFRKGLLSFVFCLTLTSTFINEPAYAEAEAKTDTETKADTFITPETKAQVKEYWKDLWSTQDQQGQKSFSAQEYQSAAKSFSDPKWKASANYRAGNFKEALEQYSQSDDSSSLYNTANTLANMNKLQEAADTYKTALEKLSTPDLEENLSPARQKYLTESAQNNLDYVNELLEQQKQQQSENNSEKKEDNSEQQSENQNQEQESSSDDSSKSNESNSDDSEQKDSEDSKSEGADSGEKQEDSSNSENETDAQDQDNQNEESQEPEQAQAQENKKEEAPEETSNKKEQSEPIDEDKNSQENADSTQNDVLSQLSQEEQQSLKQWLQRIPDNPGELLRIKFRNNTLLKQKKSDSTETQYKGEQW